MEMSEVNCSNDPLTTEELFQDIEPYGIAVVTVESVLLVASWLIFAETYHRISKRMTDNAIQRRCVYMILLYPLLITSSYISVIVPKTAPASVTAVSLYLAVVLYQFLYLVQDYFGGLENFLKVMSSTEVSLASFPVCMCRCLPTVFMTPANVKRLRYCILQNAVLRPALSYTMLLVSMATDSYPSRYQKDMPYFYVIMVINLSTLLAMYSIGVLRRSIQDYLHDCKISQKFNCLRLVLITTIMQETILSILTATNVIPCQETGPLANQTRSLWINNNLLIFEMFLLLIWARFLYKIARGNIFGYVPVSTEDREKIESEIADKSLGDSTTVTFPQDMNTNSRTSLA